jgi:hypothetical protein
MSSESEDSDSHEVEAIRNHHWNKKRGVMEFYIKWLGWTELENTWVAADDLNCPIIMNKYLKLHPFAGNLDKMPKSMKKDQVKLKPDPKITIKNDKSNVNKDHGKRHSWEYQDSSLPAAKAFTVPDYDSWDYQQPSLSASPAPEALPINNDMLLGNLYY